MRFSGKAILRAVLIRLAIAAFLVAGIVIFLMQPVLPAAKVNVGDKVDPDRLRKHVETLAITFAPRDFEHLGNLNRARAYIAAELAATGAQVSQQTYSVDHREYANVIARFGPDTTERVVVGAHYDACGALPAADDNASGIAGLLELAHLLAQHPPAMRTELVGFSLEEPPYFSTKDMGSFRHAQRLRDQRVKLRGMLSLEMLGYYSDEPGSQHYAASWLKLLYPDKGNFIAVVGRPSDVPLLRRVKRGMAAVKGLPVYSLNAPETMTGLSDNLSYWHSGYRAVMITDTAFLRNANYHQASDTPDTLNYERMAKVVEQVFGAVVELEK